MSMGIPVSSIYMSHMICISPIDGNHINTKTKSHHAPASEAPPLRRKSYDSRQPYVELLPSHISFDVIVTSEHIHLYFLYIVTWCSFQDVL